MFGRLTVCSRWAGAGEAVDKVYTGTSMEARLRVAFINIVLTVHPLIAWFALEQWKEKYRLAHCVKHDRFTTYKLCTHTSTTNTYTHTHSWGFTYFTLICALIALARSSIAARVWLALVEHLITVAPRVSWLALALVGITHIHTPPRVLTHTFHFQTYSNLVKESDIRDWTYSYCAFKDSVWSFPLVYDLSALLLITIIVLLLVEIAHLL